MRYLITILGTIALAWIAVFAGGSAPALAIMLRPALFENLVIPALLAAPSIVVLAFSMGVLLFRVQPDASPSALCIGAGLVSFAPLVFMPYILAPVSSAAHLLAGLFVGLPSILFRRHEFAAFIRNGFIAATALVFCVTLWFSAHHTIRPSVMAIGPLQPSPNVPTFNRVGTSLEEMPQQKPVGSPIGQQAALPSIPPGLEREQRFQESFRRALSAGTLPRNPELQRMRDAVVDDAAVVKAVPCDTAARSVLHDAVVTFIRDLPLIANRDHVEIFSADGITRETTIVFNQPALNVTRAALHAGLVAIEELPAMARASFAEPQPADAVALSTTLRCPSLSVQP